jgi:hypothetical protein
MRTRFIAGHWARGVTFVPVFLLWLSSQEEICELSLHES